MITKKTKELLTWCIKFGVEWLCNKIVKMWLKFIVFLTSVSVVCSVSLNNSTTTQRHQQNIKFTSEELLTRRFPRKISRDVDLDPCKAGKTDYYLLGIVG